MLYQTTAETTESTNSNYMY